MFSEVCLKSVLLSLFFGSFRPFSPQKAFFVRNFVSTAVASLSGGGLRPGAGGGGVIVQILAVSATRFRFPNLKNQKSLRNQKKSLYI